MSNFIELTNFDDGDVALINIDRIEFVSPHEKGGTVLVTYDGRGLRGEDRFYHVREPYKFVRQKIFRCNVSSSISSITFDFIEKTKCVICDDLCRHPRECLDQDKLDEKCENCPLCDLLA